MAFDLSAQLGLCPSEDAARVERHLAAIGLPTSPTAIGGRVWDADRLIENMQHDKKLSGGRLNFILARGIGRAFIAKDVNIADVKALLIEAAAPDLTTQTTGSSINAYPRPCPASICIRAATNSAATPPERPLWDRRQHDRRETYGFPNDWAARSKPASRSTTCGCA
jgi:hypothetical protein